MRSIIDKEKIIANLTKPSFLESFLSNTELEILISQFDNSLHKIEKNTGPVTVNINPELHNEIYDDIIERLKKYLDYNFTVYSAFFFYTDVPHIIHNDDSYELPVTFKAITLPLKIFPAEGYIGDYPSLCFFEQYYLEGPSKFFNKSKNIPTFYNKCVYDYGDVQNKKIDGISQKDKTKYLTHIKDVWLEGLSLESCIDWKPGRAIIFDNCRLHCASNFRDIGIKSKLGLSIFTCL